MLTKKLLCQERAEAEEAKRRWDAEAKEALDAENLLGVFYQELNVAEKKVTMPPWFRTKLGSL